MLQLSNGGGGIVFPHAYSAPRPRPQILHDQGYNKSQPSNQATIKPCLSFAIQDKCLRQSLFNSLSIFVITNSLSQYQLILANRICMYDIRNTACLVSCKQTAANRQHKCCIYCTSGLFFFRNTSLQRLCVTLDIYD